MPERQTVRTWALSRPHSRANRALTGFRRLPVLRSIGHNILSSEAAGTISALRVLGDSADLLLVAVFDGVRFARSRQVLRDDDGTVGYALSCPSAEVAELGSHWSGMEKAEGPTWH